MGHLCGEFILNYIYIHLIHIYIYVLNYYIIYLSIYICIIYVYFTVYIYMYAYDDDVHLLSAPVYIPYAPW